MLHDGGILRFTISGSSFKKDAVDSTYSPSIWYKKPLILDPFIKQLLLKELYYLALF